MSGLIGLAICLTAALRHHDATIPEVVSRRIEHSERIGIKSDVGEQTNPAQALVWNRANQLQRGTGVVVAR